MNSTPEGVSRETKNSTPEEVSREKIAWDLRVVLKNAATESALNCQQTISINLNYSDTMNDQLLEGIENDSGNSADA